MEGLPTSGRVPTGGVTGPVARNRADCTSPAPNPRFGIRTVRTRVYRGRCVNNELLPETLQLFRDKRAEIESLIENQAELTSKTRRSMLDYVDDFYDVIDNPRMVESHIVKRCI